MILAITTVTQLTTILLSITALIVAIPCLILGIYLIHELVTFNDDRK